MPFTVHANGLVLRYPTGPEFGGDRFLKVELDFGDGSGWQDVTQDVSEKWSDPSDPYALENMTPHTYTTPGDYYVNARVTFWDGEVLYAVQQPHIIVLPAGSAP